MMRYFLLFFLLPGVCIQAQDIAFPKPSWNISGEMQSATSSISDDATATAVIQNETATISDTIETLYAKGLELLKAGDALSASHVFGKVLEARPLEGKAHTNLARALLTLKDVKDASFHAVKGVRYGPDSSAWNVLGLVYMAKGEKTPAREAFEKAITLYEGNAWAHNNLGWLHYRAGRIELAEKYLRRAAELSPKSPVIQINLAYVLESVGKHEEAARTWRLARELEPREGKKAPDLERTKTTQFKFLFLR